MAEVYTTRGRRNEPEFRRCIAEKAIIRFKHRVRELTRRHRGITLERMIRVQGQGIIGRVLVDAGRRLV